VIIEASSTFESSPVCKEWCINIHKVINQNIIVKDQWVIKKFTGDDIRPGGHWRGKQSPSLTGKVETLVTGNPPDPLTPPGRSARVTLSIVRTVVDPMPLVPQQRITGVPIIRVWQMTTITITNVNSIQE